MNESEEECPVEPDLRPDEPWRPTTTRTCDDRRRPLSVPGSLCAQGRVQHVRSSFLLAVLLLGRALEGCLDKRKTCLGTCAGSDSTRGSVTTVDEPRRRRPVDFFTAVRLAEPSNRWRPELGVARVGCWTGERGERRGREGRTEGRRGMSKMGDAPRKSDFDFGRIANRLPDLASSLTTSDHGFQQPVCERCEVRSRCRGSEDALGGAVTPGYRAYGREQPGKPLERAESERLLSSFSSRTSFRNGSKIPRNGRDAQVQRQAGSDRTNGEPSVRRALIIEGRPTFWSASVPTRLSPDLAFDSSCRTHHFGNDAPSWVSECLSLPCRDAQCQHDLVRPSVAIT